MSYGVSGIYRYPIKGLTPELLDGVELEAGAALPGDRQFALALPEADFDPAAPEWRPKTEFLMLMRDEALAALRVECDAASGAVRITRDGATPFSASLADAAGRAAFGGYMASYMGLAEPPRLVSADGHSFSDHRAQVVSLINLRSIEALSDYLGQPVDPLRFRANVYFEGDAPWQEFDWLGQTLEWGGARLDVTMRIVRCAATNVDPATAARDLNIPKALQQGFGHVDMGIYARVTAGGRVSRTDRVSAIKA